MLRKQFVLVALLLLMGLLNATLLISDDFTGDVGTLLTAAGWTAHSGAGTTPLSIASPGLDYTGYLSSGIGNATSATVNGEDVNKSFAATTTGSIYYSFLVNTATTYATTGYPIHLMQSSTTFYAKFWMVLDAGNVKFGLSKTANTPVYDAANYAVNTTYLVVIKYTFNADSATDDAVYMWVNPAISNTEPTPNVSVTAEGSADATSLNAIGIRQYNAATLSRYDGFRVGTEWSDVGGGAVVNNPPTISNIVITPAVIDIESTDTVSVSATITDIDGTVSSAQLRWGTAPGTYTETIAMTAAGSDYTTSTDIPAQIDGTIVYFVVEATDDDAATATSGEISYTVTDPIVVIPTMFLEENFPYEALSYLTANGWTAHSGAGTNPPIVGSNGLTYPNYTPASGLAAQTVASGSAEDVHKTFEVQTSGTVYTAFLFNASSFPNTTGDYIFHMGPSPIGTDFKGRFWVQKGTTDNLRFGLTKAGAVTAAVWTDSIYAQNTTYLVLLKYVINPGTANDEVYMWINPDFSGAEPAPQLTAPDPTGTDAASIGAVAIRQGTNTPLAKIDGIRVANDWATLWSNVVPPTPVIAVSGEPVPLVNIAGLPSEEVSQYNLSGDNLTGPITIVAPVDFEVSSSTTTGWANQIQVPADFAGLIYVRLVSSSVGTHGGLITHNSPGAEQVTMAIEGETFAPAVVWNVNQSLVPFTQEAGTPSAAQFYSLSATNATAPIFVAVEVPFELGLTDVGPWTQSLELLATFNGSVYVRMNSATAGDFTGTITHNTTNASPYEIPVAGSATPPAGNYATDLFFSEYIEGSSNNKALEIFNGTGIPVDLGGYKVILYSNGSSTPGNTLTFTAGTMLAHNDVYVIANASANATILGLADVTSTVTYYNGDDAIALVKTTSDTTFVYVDIFGVIGSDPGTMWISGSHQTLDRTLVRKPTVTEGVSVNPTGTGTGAFLTLETEWDVYPIDTIDYLGAHTFSPGVLVAEAPVLSPAGGVYATTQNVSMTTPTPGATIYYTTDGSVPSDTNGTAYSVPVPVSTTTTIKAITYAPNYTPSGVTTETYVFPTLIPDIVTLRAQATGTTIYRLTGEAVLTFQQVTRHQKYIQDATAAIVIDDPAGIITTVYNLYDGITGVTGTLGVYNGLLQFTPVADPGAATSTNNVVIPEVRTLASLTTADQAKLIKVMNVTVDATLVTYPATAANINVTDPTATLVMRTFPATDYSGTPIHTVPVNITCLVGEYLATMQISPRFLADFETYVGTLDTPVVTITQAADIATLSWTAITGATSYRVEAADDPFGIYTELGVTSDLTYTHATAAKKFYRVTALN